MARIFLGLGSNIEDTNAYFDDAISFLTSEVTDIQESKRYETEPFGYLDQDMFLNSVIVGQTKLKPKKLLAFVKQVEKQVGRKKRFRNGPREIDIDILFYDDLVMETEDLTIPHIGAHKRYSVLQPMMDLDPEYVHPKLGKRIKELLLTL